MEAMQNLCLTFGLAKLMNCFSQVPMGNSVWRYKETYIFCMKQIFIS